MRLIDDVVYTYKGAFLGMIIGLPFGFIASLMLNLQTWLVIIVFMALGGGKMSFEWTEYGNLDYGGTLNVLLLGLGVVFIGMLTGL